MTQEQKARAYDEAIERAKKVHKYSSDLAEIKRMEYIFPELREDEQIRKELVAFIKKRDRSGCDYNYNKWITWLEKQGEQKPVVIIPKFRVGDEIITENEESLTITRIDEKGYWSNDLFVCDFDSECVWDLVEQKPAWSEEDRDYYDAIITKLEVTQNDAALTNNQMEFLKSLKDRIVLQSQQEWSEEDEKNISTIRIALRDAKLDAPQEFESYGREITVEDFENAESWLKSIKPQPKQQWTEEDEGFLNLLLSIFTNKHPNGLFSTGNIISFNGNCFTSNEIITWLKSIKDKVQPKSAKWSEEDEKRLKSCLNILQPKTLLGNTETINTKWLKSLKNRIQPQNLIVTDEELVQAKKDAYNEILDKIEYHDDWPTFDDGWNAAIWYLKKRNTMPQSWTKEDKERYISCLQRLGTGNPEQPETINSRWFKEHVYPQKQWKPSDEQMIALSEASGIVGMYSLRGMNLQSLYNDLKKL